MMKMLDWTSSSRRVPVQQPHSSENRQCPAQWDRRALPPCNATALGLPWALLAAPQEHRAPSTRRDWQEPCPCLSCRGSCSAPIAPDLRSSGSDSTMTNTNWGTGPVRAPCSGLSGPAGIIPTDQGMPPWRYSPTLSLSVTRSRCSSTRKMLFLERKFTLSRDTKVGKELSEKLSLIRDFLS